jgi:aryl-alcohol dehydrogenase-like predicted oxidoreductase
MERRRLAGFEVSAVGFGCGNVGGLMVRGEAGLRARAAAEALAGGIDYFDTAAQYGDGRSEENLGAALREAGALHTARVGTKVRLREADAANPAPALRAALEAGLRRLGRDHVDVLHLHNPVIGPLDAVADAMARLVDAGLARQIGITGLGDTAALRAAVASSRFATMQTYVNVLNPSAFFPGAAGGAQDFAGCGREAAAAGMGLLAIRVMAAGAVAGPGPRPPLAGGTGGSLTAGGGYDQDLARVAAIAAVPGELGLEGGMPELALRFALSVEGVSTALVGFSDLDQLSQAIRWAERGPLPPGAVERIVAAAR